MTRPTSNEQHVHRIERDGTELGFVVVDSTIAGRARGGLRLAPGVTELELRAAARAMTLKYGLLGLPQGGAKAGLHGDPDAPLAERRECLLAFGRAIEPLLRARVYVPDADLGTRADDIRWMMQTLGLPVRRHDWNANRSGEYTAVSCVAAARAAAARRGRTLADCRIAVEGFGSVGAAAARLAGRAGARIVAVSTSRGALHDPRGLDLDRLLALAARVGSRVVEEYPAERLPREALLELPVDVLCPCARHHGIHDGNVRAIAAPIIAPGANDPMTPEAERELVARGVLVVPDFVANSGGVLGGTLEFAGVDPVRIASTIDRYVGETVRALIRVAERRAVPLRAVAEPLALARHDEVRRAAQQPSLGSRAVGAAIELYRRGWIPRRAVAAFAPHRLTSGAVRVGATADTDWDAEWDRAWKAHPANAWFPYQAQAYVAWVQDRLAQAGGPRPQRVLKTDAFEEACGFRYLERLCDPQSSVLMDVSPRILGRALGPADGKGLRAAGCVTDVRRLALRPASFDLVLSPSTLDHFADTRDIAAALAELRGALRPGGHLLVTLDNPRNPVLRFREAVHGMLGPIGGVIPFPMGRTLSRAELVAALGQAGFEVLDSGYLVHAPRIVGLWLGEWAARRGSRRTAARVQSWLAGVDRALAVRPLGPWSAHFVAAHARRPR